MICEAAINLIKHYEGCELTAYTCPAGVLTIGYGHTKGVKVNDTITQLQAESWLKEELGLLEKHVNNMVRIRLTDNQRGALVSFAYNVGVTALKNATLLQKLNTCDINGAAMEFLKWNKITVKGKKKECRGLTARRTAEQALFLGRL